MGIEGLFRIDTDTYSLFVNVCTKEVDTTLVYNSEFIVNSKKRKKFALNMNNSVRVSSFLYNLGNQQILKLYLIHFWVPDEYRLLNFFPLLLFTI